jgi:hypothetical protein
MVDDKRHSDQKDFEFVQNLFDQVESEFASPELKAKILMSATGGKNNTGFAELLDYLWPFGALWRPAAGLAMAAMFGIMLGLSDPLSTTSSVDTDDTLIKEIAAFAMAADSQLENIQ